MNLAYLLNVRSDTEIDASNQERVADLVWANRIRREVVPLCEQELAEIAGRDARCFSTACELNTEIRNRDWEAHFWCLATQAEAYFGLGLHVKYAEARAKAETLTPSPAGWMLESFDGQIARLRELLDRQGHLLSPAWTSL